MTNNKPLVADGVWFHACSYGEARSLYPLIDILPVSVLRLSSITQTGHGAMAEKSPQQCRYLPFEPWLLFWMKPQYILIVMEAELWYMLFALAKKKGSKTILVNARVSDASWSRYKRFNWLYRRIFRYIDEVYAQRDIDQERLVVIGAKNVKVTGNIKLASIPKPNRIIKKQEGLLICAASTHKGEEEIILDSFAQLRKQVYDAKLIIVPRHPERFENVAEMSQSFCKNNNMKFGLYSQAQSLENDLTVVDKLGELINLYAISDIVILGGAFGKYGGHNAAEAAQFGCRIISGEYYYNQRDIFDSIEGIVVVDKEKLTQKLLDYESLPMTKITQQTNLEPIIHSIKQTLKERENGTSL